MTGDFFTGTGWALTAAGVEYDVDDVLVFLFHHGIGDLSFYGIGGVSKCLTTFSTDAHTASRCAVPVFDVLSLSLNKESTKESQPRRSLLDLPFRAALHISARAETRSVCLPA